MNRSHLIILSLLISIVGCSSASPRGIAWGFRKRPKPDLAKKTEREADDRSSKTAMGTMGKTFRKKPGADKKERHTEGKQEDEQNLAVNDLLDRAREFDERNDLKQAETLYKEVLEKDHDNAVAIRRLANIADLQNRFRDAEEYYNRGLALRPNDPELLNDLGYSYSLQERYEESEATLRKALAIKPDHVYAMNNLGYLHAKRAQRTNDFHDYQVALELFQEANGPEAAQQTIQELFPNGPPQALAQTSNSQTNPFSARPVTPPSSRNPFEPNQPTISPQPQASNTSASNNTPIASTNPFQSNQNQILPTSATPQQSISNQGMNQQSFPPPYSQGMNSQATNTQASNTQAMNAQAMNTMPPNISAMNPSEGTANSIDISPGHPNQGNMQAPATSMQTNNSSSPDPSQPPSWNTTPANGGMPNSPMWESAQRSAAQMSLNAMFPVANAAGQPATTPQQAVQSQYSNPGSPGMYNPNPSTGWTNNLNNQLDRQYNLNGSLATNPQNGMNQIPAQNQFPNQNQNPVQNQNPGGWQSQPVNGGGLPGPNPFEELPAIQPNMQGQLQQGQLQQGQLQQGQLQQGQPMQGMRSTGFPNQTNGTVKPVGATATDIELFESELMNTNDGAYHRTPTGTATATY